MFQSLFTCSESDRQAGVTLAAALQRNHGDDIRFSTVQVSEGAASAVTAAGVDVPILRSRRGNIGITGYRSNPGH